MSESSDERPQKRPPKLVKAVTEKVTAAAQGLSAFVKRTNAFSITRVKKPKEKPKKLLAGEEELMHWMEQAQYEYTTDPYRGIQPWIQDANNQDPDIIGPWRLQCSLANDTDNQQTDDLEPSEAIVRRACSTACPSLIAWTKLNLRSNNKKRKRLKDAQPQTLGRRPEDPSFRCACDYNPFCLESLGGAMYDVITNWESDPDVTEDLTSGIIDWNDESSSRYSSKTTEKLKLVRRSCRVNEDSIRKHLKDTLKDLVSALSVDDGLQRIRSIHGNLGFTNPMVDDGDETMDGKCTLAMPPGIENLGATCYLNTQLQCLAQNRVFVNGINSWVPPSNSKDRMSSVLSLFQNLLLRMNKGPHRRENTIEFSNALGLDHYEQQDPNEFSRLLLERIHVAFQETNGVSGGGDLSELLPSLFQGIISYETKCLECKTVSERKEEFMDVNLPIVKSPPASAGPKQRTIMESFNGKSSPGNSKSTCDLQYCLDRYLDEERFDGDNQYFCAKCGCKRDAVRSSIFEKMPPVLNVQLSRYVFNRKSLAKEKLSDPVLLPRTLALKAKGKERKLGLVEHRYVLCAVMRHKGKSAYSGHYIAEAMDWLSGQWYEFNDEIVSLLEDGPSSSYHVGGETKEVKGSTDAYNMYYVEEKFLAQSILECLSENRELKAKAFNQIELERTEYYLELSQMCLDDGNAAARLDRRRSSILSEMFPDPQAAQLSTVGETGWIWTPHLRNFLSCKDTADECNEYTISKLLSRGGGLHPRIARNGKLLPLSVCKAYAKIIRQERRDALRNMDDEVFFIPADQIISASYAADYQAEIGSSLQQVTKLKSLYDAIDRNKGLPREFEDVPPCDDEPGQFGYVVARDFITLYRNKMVAAMKAAGNSTTHVSASTRIDKDRLGAAAQVSCEGLDYVQDFYFDPTLLFDTSASQFPVNNSILCHHGNFAPQTRAHYRYTVSSVWNQIKELFPTAIEIKFRQGVALHEVNRNHDHEGHDFRCRRCVEETQAKSSLQNSFAELAPWCRKVQTIESWDGAALDGSKYRIVREDELDSWKSFANITKRSGKTDSSADLVRRAEKILFYPTESSDDSVINGKSGDEAILVSLRRTFRPIVCKSHGLPIESALFDTKNESKMPVLRDDVKVIDEAAYFGYLTGIVTALRLLHRSEDSKFLDTSIHEKMSQSGQFYSRRGVDDGQFHPMFTRVPSDLTKSQRFCVSSDQSSPIFYLERMVCRHKDCIADFHAWESSTPKKSKSLKPKEETTSINESQVRGGKDSPITVDSDIEEINPSVVLRVFGLKDDVTMEDALISLDRCLGTDASNDTVRRSARSRRQRFALGDIEHDDTLSLDRSANIAALRLLLLERCTAFELDHDLKVAISIQPRESVDAGNDQSDDDPSNRWKIFDLSFDRNIEVFVELYEKSVTSCGVGASSGEPSVYLVLRQASIDMTSLDIGKEGLMDHLISLSNMISDDSPGKPGKRSKKQKTEKGFSGTFLLSGIDDDTGGKSEAARSPGSRNDANDTMDVEDNHLVIDAGISKSDDTKGDRKSPVSSADVELLKVDRKSIQTEGAESGKNLSRPTKSRFFRHNDQSAQSHNSKASTAPVPLDLNDDSDDDSLLMTEGPFSARRTLVKDVVRLLKSNPDLFTDSLTDPTDMMTAAVEAVVQRYPKEKKASILLDEAYMKYLELVSS